MRALALVCVLAGSVCAQESPREAGEALRTSLGAEVDEARAGRVALDVRVGERVVGTLEYTTEVVRPEGEAPYYQLEDRLVVTLPDMGQVALRLRARVGADLRVLALTLSAEEPRGSLGVARRELQLERRDGRWVRIERRGFGGAPTEQILEARFDVDVLVFTPPLGVGARLAQWAPQSLGARYSLGGIDLETGQASSWRMSVEERGQVDALEGVRLAQSESAARLEHWVELGTGRTLRLRAEGASRWTAGPTPAHADEDPAKAAVLTLLRALAAGDRAAALEVLDVEALATASGCPADEVDTFTEVLLETLTDETWLRRSEWDLLASAALAEDLTTETLTDGRVAVDVVGAEPRTRFVVLAGRVVALPQ